MKLLKHFLTFVGAKLAFAAEVPQTENEETENFAQGTAVSVINKFSGELWVEISSFLPFPQRELGYLNKTASNAVFKLFPYRRFVAQRFGIQELLNANSDKDLAWFNNLLLIKNPVEIFRSISSGLFDQCAFPNTKGPISRYILRFFRSLPAEVAATLNPDESILLHFVVILYEIEGYSEIIEIFKLFPQIISRALNYSSLERSTKLIKQIFKVSEETDPEFFRESVSTFNLLLQNIVDETRKSEFEFLYCCILANIPLNIYIDRLLNNFPQVLRVSFYGSHPKLSVEESQRIYETLLVILDRFCAKLLETEEADNGILEKIYESHKIMLKLGFKAEIEENIYELEIKNGEFDKNVLREFANYALFSRRINLFKQIFNDERLGQFEDDSFLDINQFFFSDFVYAINAYEQFPEEKRKSLLNNLDFFRRFRLVYDAVKINFDEDKILTISFKRSDLNLDLDNPFALPETFEYVLDTKNGSITASKVLAIIMMSNTILENEEFIEFFRSIVNCPYFAEALALTQSVPLQATMNMIKRFSQSEQLYNLAQESGLKFRFDYRMISNLFRERIFGANFVAFERELFEFLPWLSTRTQIQNFEQFMGKNIADIFLIDALPTIKQEDPVSYYYKCRTLLHHWLNGPHRERLLELDIPFFRRMLAKEVCESDAVFLTEGLEPEILQQLNEAHIQVGQDVDVAVDAGQVHQNVE